MPAPNPEHEPNPELGGKPRPDSPIAPNNYRNPAAENPDVTQPKPKLKTERHWTHPDGSLPKPELKLFPPIDEAILIRARKAKSYKRYRNAMQAMGDAHVHERFQGWFRARLGEENAFDATTLASDALILVCKNLDRWDPNYVSKSGKPGKFIYWAMSQCQTVLSSYYRHGNRYESWNDLYYDSNPEEFKFSCSSQRDWVDACKKQDLGAEDVLLPFEQMLNEMQKEMTPLERKVFGERFLRGRSIKDVAKTLNISEDAVNKRIRSIKEKTLDRFGQDGWDTAFLERQLALSRAFNRLKRQIVAAEKANDDWRTELGDRLADLETDSQKFVWIEEEDGFFRRDLQNLLSWLPGRIHKELHQTLLLHFALGQPIQDITADLGVPQKRIKDEAKKINTAINRLLPGEKKKAERFCYRRCLEAYEQTVMELR